MYGAVLSFPEKFSSAKRNNPFPHVDKAGKEAHSQGDEV